MDLVISAGNYYQSNDQLSCGGHTARFAYYASLNGNRSNYGPRRRRCRKYVRDADNGYGGFASFIFNPNPKNQFRVVGSLRQDYYQIPIDPGSRFNRKSELSQLRTRDAEREPDGYATFSWVHTFNPNMLLTVSPFYHYNGADYKSSPNDFPVASTVTENANYAGAQVAFNATFWKNDLQAGVYGFGQHQYELLRQFIQRRRGEFPRFLHRREWRRHGPLHQRQIQSHSLADLDCGPSPNGIRFLHFRERHRSLALASP